MNNSINQAVQCLVLSNPSAPVQSKFNTSMRQGVHIRIGVEEHHIWDNCPSIIASWKQGTTQYVRQNNKGYYEAVESYNEANAPQVETPRPMAAVAAQVRAAIPNADVKGEAVNYVRFQVAMYKGIFEEVQKTMQDKGLPVELEKDIATTVYIQTVKRFSM